MSHLVLGLGHQKKGVEVVPGSEGAEWWTGEELEEQRELSSASNLQGQPRATRLRDTEAAQGAHRLFVVVLTYPKVETHLMQFQIFP